MAKYNLMDNQRPDYFDRYFDEEEEAQEPSKDEKEAPEKQPESDLDTRDYFDESLFTEEKESEETEEPLAKDELKEEIEQPSKTEKAEPEILEEDILGEGPIIEKAAPEVEPESEAEQKEKSPLEDYADTKMQKINLKPLLIGAVTIIALLLIIFVLYNWVFVGGEEVVEEKQPVITPQEQLKTEQEKKKIAFIKNISAQKKSRLSFFSNLSDLRMQKVTYSSVLLYDNSFSFEIFAPSRDEIAKFNVNVKNKNLSDKYKIVFVGSRPGSKGGIFALYKAEINKKAGAASVASEPQIKPNIQALIKSLAKKNSLTIRSDRSVSKKRVDQFDMLRMEYTYHGSESNCLKFLKDLSDANNNFSVHKIVLLPTNQRDFTNSKYQLLIVLDYYV